MKSVKWRWWLPIVLLILTVACQIYAGHQDQVAKDRSFHHHSIFLLPPFPDRLMRFVSFPALALAAPLGHLDFAFFHYYFFHAFESWGAVLITVEDIGFFVGVFSCGTRWEQRSTGVSGGVARRRRVARQGWRCWRAVWASLS